MSDIRCGSCGNRLEFHSGVSYCPTCQGEDWVKERIQIPPTNTGDNSEETKEDSLSFDVFTAKTVKFMARLDNPTEADTQMKVITPFIEQLGWSRRSSLVRLEYAPAEGISHRPDYLLLRTADEPQVAIEAKSWRANLGSSEKTQMKTYLRIYNLRLGILTNGYEYHFFIRQDRDSLEIEDPIVRTLDQLSLDEGFLQVFRPEDKAQEVEETVRTISAIVARPMEYLYQELLTEDPDHAIPKKVLLGVYNRVTQKGQNSELVAQEFWSEMYDRFINREEVGRTRSLTPGSNKTSALFGYKFSEEGIQYLSEEQKQHPAIKSMLKQDGSERPDRKA